MAGCAFTLRPGNRRPGRWKPRVPHRPQAGLFRPASGQPGTGPRHRELRLDLIALRGGCAGGTGRHSSTGTRMPGCGGMALGTWRLPPHHLVVTTPEFESRAIPLPRRGNSPHLDGVALRSDDLIASLSVQGQPQVRGPDLTTVSRHGEPHGVVVRCRCCHGCCQRPS
jgi:hypothetical protein